MTNRHKTPAGNRHPFNGRILMLGCGSVGQCTAGRATWKVGQQQSQKLRAASTDVVQTQTGPIRCCEWHTARWHRIADALGTHLRVEPLLYQRGGLGDAELRFAAMEFE